VHNLQTSEKHQDRFVAFADMLNKTHQMLNKTNTNNLTSFKRVKKFLWHLALFSGILW
jgi:uncharacterized protein YaaR (DUF327 family)